MANDHAFRSPAVMVQDQGLYVALTPDLDLLMQSRPVIRHALDLRRVQAGRCETGPSPSSLPLVSYGFCTWEVDEHVYYKHEPRQPQAIPVGELSYGFALFFGEADGPEEVTQRVNSYLWSRYARRYLQDIRPQVLPFEQMSFLEVQYDLTGSSRKTPGIRFWLEGPLREKRLRAILFEDTVVWNVSHDLEKLYTELGTFFLQGEEIVARPAAALSGRPGIDSDWRAILRAVLGAPLP